MWKKYNVIANIPFFSCISYNVGGHFGNWLDEVSFVSLNAYMITYMCTVLIYFPIDWRRRLCLSDFMFAILEFLKRKRQKYFFSFFLIQKKKKNQCGWWREEIFMCTQFDWVWWRNSIRLVAVQSDTVFYTAMASFVQTYLYNSNFCFFFF